jgi:ankyrin repeat protein
MQQLETDTTSQRAAAVAQPAGISHAMHKIIKYEYSGRPINEQTEDGETPLYVACQQGHEQVVRLLLKYKDKDKYK